jgi:exopolyphosphatase/guanosine-5'-triphosphate,3'-diphosphate pyrophosphatase
VARPRIIAVIDVGSNSVRLLVARELSPEAFEVVDEERFDARLAQGQTDGQLTPEGIERGLRALRVMTAVARSHGPDFLVAAGTEALRRAANAEEFIERSEAETGVPIRILSAEEEAYASFLGTINSTGLVDGHIVDIGGGSLELIRVEGRRMVNAQSVPLGAIYAVEHYLPGDPPARKEVRALRRAVRAQLEVARGFPVLVGGGGAVRNLARIARARRRYPLRRLHGLRIRRKDVSWLALQLAGKPAEERRRIPAVSAARADILHGPAIVIDELMNLLGAEALEVTGQGLREGLVWQQLRPGNPVLEDVRGASVAGLARANGVAPGATRGIAEAAVALFEATAPVHNLEGGWRALLEYAAHLSTMGIHVEYYNRDRHAEYLVHSGNLHGFSHREIVLLAALVRWAESGSPDFSLHEALLEPGDAAAVAALAPLLGAAKAVYRRRQTAVDHFEASLDEGGLRVLLRGRDSMEGERLALERQQKRLEQALGVPLVVSYRPW